jgi:hypothetical protein
VAALWQMATMDLSGTAAPSYHVCSMKNLLVGLKKKYTNPSLSRLITSPRDQVLVEVFHCVLNLVMTHFEILKLLCNKLFKEEVVAVDKKGAL